MVVNNFQRIDDFRALVATLAILADVGDTPEAAAAAFRKAVEPRPRTGAGCDNPKLVPKWFEAEVGRIVSRGRLAWHPVADVDADTARWWAIAGLDELAKRHRDATAALAEPTPSRFRRDYIAPVERAAAGLVVEVTSNIDAVISRLGTRGAAELVVALSRVATIPEFVTDQFDDTNPVEAAVTCADARNGFRRGPQFEAAREVIFTVDRQLALREVLSTGAPLPRGAATALRELVALVIGASDVGRSAARKPTDEALADLRVRYRALAADDARSGSRSLWEERPI